MSAVGFPLAFMLVPLGVPSAVILFGEIWRGAGQAATVMAGFCVGGILISYVSEVVKAYGRPDIQARTQLVSVVSATAFMLALLPFGLLGIVAGFSAGSLAGGAYGLWRVARLLDFHPSELVSRLWASTVASAAMAGLLAALEILVVHASSHGVATGVALLGLEAALGLAVYAACLHLLAPGTLRDLLSMTGRLRPSRRKPEPASSGASAPVTIPED
jgi:PST family polysaccharide transporter